MRTILLMLILTLCLIGCQPVKPIACPVELPAGVVWEYLVFPDISVEPLHPDADSPKTNVAMHLFGWGGESAQSVLMVIPPYPQPQEFDWPVYFEDWEKYMLSGIKKHQTIQKTTQRAESFQSPAFTGTAATYTLTNDKGKICYYKFYYLRAYGHPCAGCFYGPDETDLARADQILMSWDQPMPFDH
ncbi:MAG: hypothetical protein JW709_07010 [Sedimentisphaerales bacterium]|nr:hypothetical protein [Sedimentisphaerales bacterium]